MNRMSVSRFSEEFGIPRRTAHQYLSGKSKPGSDHLASLASRGLNIEWLLTGKINPQLVFDLSRVTELLPVSGIILSDPDISNAFMRDAVELIDELVRENSDLAAAAGFLGLVKSVWWIFSKYAEAAEMHAERIEQARRDGWTADEIVGLITGLLRESLRKAIRVDTIPTELAAGSAKVDSAA